MVYPQMSPAANYTAEGRAWKHRLPKGSIWPQLHWQSQAPDSAPAWAAEVQDRLPVIQRASSKENSFSGTTLEWGFCYMPLYRFNLRTDFEVYYAPGDLETLHNNFFPHIAHWGELYLYFEHTHFLSRILWCLITNQMRKLTFLICRTKISTNTTTEKLQKLSFSPVTKQYSKRN